MSGHSRTFEFKFWSTMNHFERMTFVGMVLIWIGVIAFGAGLYLAFNAAQERQAAYAEATAMALLAATSVPPTSTPVTYPAGWVTATPTVRPPETVVDPVTEKIEERIDLEAGPAMLMLTPLPVTADPQPTPSFTPTLDATRVVPTPTPRTPSGPPDRIVIPSIKLDSPVVPVGWHVVTQGNVQYSVWDVADYAAGWHKTSAWPGQVGNVVISGHNNIRGEVFRDLIDVQVGELVLLYVGDQIYYYEVAEKHLLAEYGQPLEVRRENAAWIAPKEDERLTLVTCWPYTGNSHRLVVVARPTTPPADTGLVQE